jgi:mRNA interferase MazF
MAHVGAVLQWELYFADLDPVVGREQGGDSRPVLILSNDGFNKAFDVVTVVPFTKLEGKRRKVFTFEVLMPAGIAGNPVDSIAMPQQVRTISSFRLLERIGFLADPDKRREIEDRLLDHFGITLDAEED